MSLNSLVAQLGRTHEAHASALVRGLQPNNYTGAFEETALSDRDARLARWAATEMLAVSRPSEIPVENFVKPAATPDDGLRAAMAAIIKTRPRPGARMLYHDGRRMQERMLSL
jgi:hypothetical protein